MENVCVIGIFHGSIAEQSMCDIGRKGNTSAMDRCAGIMAMEKLEADQLGANLLIEVASLAHSTEDNCFTDLTFCLFVTDPKTMSKNLPFQAAGTY